MKTNVLSRAGVLCISLFCLGVSEIHAQIGTSYIEVKIRSEDLRSNETNGLQTKNNALNTLFAQYGAQKYAQFYKGAQTPGLTEQYGIEFTGNAVDFKNALMATSGFEYVEIRPYAQLADKPVYNVNDPYTFYELNGAFVQGSKYPIELMKLKQAWDITEGSEDVTIAFVDTEFDTNHEDLQGKYKLPITNLVPGAMIQPHGTATSGIAIARVNNNKGIAGVGNKTMGAGYISDGGFSLGSGIWQAYLDGYRIINVSWTGTGLSPQAVTEMTQNGVTLVVAAGNSINAGNNIDIANIPGVILVSGHDQNGNIGSMSTARNSYVDIVAPASTVLAPRNNSTGLLYSYSNNSTSIATPQVCGVVALMKAINPCLSPIQIENIIKNSAAPVGDGASYPGLFGAGRVDAYRAVLMAQSTATNIDIVNNTVYNTDRVIYGDITVRTGKTLTITAKIKMGCRSKITVEPGAKLIIDGGEITRLNKGKGSLWQGVVLWGNRNMASNAQYHGTLEMKNNAKISYATLGVSNFVLENGAQGGGIIKVSDSKFINCRKAVGLNDYPLYSYWVDINAGVSNCSFINTEFLIDDMESLYTSGTQYFNAPQLLSSWQTKDGILIKNCTFKSLLTDNDITLANERGTAIYLAESGALIKENVFDGYTRGVLVSSVSGTPSHTVKLYNNTIKNNVLGIVVAANGNTDIRGNKISRMAKFASNVQNVYFNGYKGVGIYVDQSSGTYIGCNNEIAYEEPAENSSSGDIWTTYGIVFNLCKTGGNSVSTNTFAKLGKGIYTLGDNRNINILNNTFGSRQVTNALYFDWSDTSFKSLGAGCTANILLTNKIAGNIFTYPGNLYNFPGNQTVTYYYKIGSPTQQATYTSGSWNLMGCNSGATSDMQCIIQDVSPGGPVLAQKLSRYTDLVSNGLRFSTEADELVGDIIRTYNDNSDITELKAFLNQDNTLQSDLLLLPVSIETEDYDLYETVKNRLDKEVLGLDQKNAYIAYYDFLRDLKMSNRTFEEMTDAELKLVTNIAHNTYGVSGMAKALLDQLRIEEWVHAVRENLPEGSSRITTEKKQEDLITVYPNPVISAFTINIKPTDKEQDLQIFIFDMYGNNMLKKKLMKGEQRLALDAKELRLKEGVYIVQVVSKGEIIGVQKLAVK